MAYQKKHYRSIDAKTNRHQSRGGGTVTRKNRPHRYVSKPVETPISPTWVAARASRTLLLDTGKRVRLPGLPKSV